MIPITRTDLDHLTELAERSASGYASAQCACREIADRLRALYFRFGEIDRVPFPVRERDELSKFCIEHDAAVLEANGNWWAYGWILLSEAPRPVVKPTLSWEQEILKYDIEILRRKLKAHSE